MVVRSFPFFMEVFAVAYFNRPKIFLSALFFSISGNITLGKSAVVEFFDTAHVEKAMFCVRHTYQVADTLDQQPRTIAAIEAHDHVAEEETFPFAGSTGGCFGFEPHLHATGSVYREGLRIYIGFHGSHFPSDWISDFKFPKRDALGIHGFNGRIHLGFSQVVESSYHSMARQVARALAGTPADICEFIFCGHSLGGAVSTLAAHQFSAQLGQYIDNQGIQRQILPDGFNRHQIRLVTISSPRVGDGVFAASFATHVPLALRFYHQADVVEKVPPTQLMGYQHVGEGIKFLFGETLAAKLATTRGWSELGMNGKEFVEAAIAMKDFPSAAANFRRAPKKSIFAMLRVLKGLKPVVSIPVKMLHMVPDQDVVLRAYLFERQYAGDPDYTGVTHADLRRNDWLRSLVWFAS